MPGEDVVAGIRRPSHAECHGDASHLREARRNWLSLERLSRGADFEFTIGARHPVAELQTRNGKMNAAAMVRTSVECTNRGAALARGRAITRVNPALLEQDLFPRLDPKHRGMPRDRACLPRTARERPGRLPTNNSAETLGQAGREVSSSARKTKPRTSTVLRLAGHSPPVAADSHETLVARGWQALRRGRRRHHRGTWRCASRSSATR